MTFDTWQGLSIVGAFRQKRALRRETIATWEQVGSLRAKALGRAFYVLEAPEGNIFVDDDPGKYAILRVCRPPTPPPAAA
jgi:hypothetical protein